MLQDQMNQAAAQLSDQELAAAILAVERCALCLTRTRRELALMRLHCLRCERERRQSEEQPTLEIVTDA
jgi:hypothetical protein